MPKGRLRYQIAESISPRLAADSLAASVNGATTDMMRPIEADASIKSYKWDDEEGKHAFWHTSSHLLAEALGSPLSGHQVRYRPGHRERFLLRRRQPDAHHRSRSRHDRKQNGRTRPQQGSRSSGAKCPRPKPLKTFTEKGDQYKVELITALEDGTISFYTNGAFTDLCRGPHIPNTGYIKAIKLTSVAGAYWRGNEKNKMLTRIYGISFPKKSMLDEYLAMMEEAKKRDHRNRARTSNSSPSQRVGQDCPLWLPKGRRPARPPRTVPAQRPEGVRIPAGHHPAHRQQGAYVTSGHYAKYGKDSFQPIHTPIEGEEYLLKTDELPAPLRNLPLEAPFVQGAAGASGRIRYGLPLRAVG